VQFVEEKQDDLNKSEILVSEPKKIGDGINAYIVYKVTTRVRIFRLSLQKAVSVVANLNLSLFIVCHSKLHTSVAAPMLL